MEDQPATESTNANPTLFEQAVAAAESGDIELAKRLYQTCVENGEVDAMFNLYKILSESDRRMDHMQAIEYLKDAANLGDADSCVELFWVFREDRLTDADKEQAMFWLQKGADLGSAEANFRLYLEYDASRDVEQRKLGLRFLLQAAEASHDRALYFLAFHYQYGELIDKNESYAVSLLERSADLEYPAAIEKLGYCYLHGEMVEKDPDKAGQLFDRASDYDGYAGWSGLAYLYEHGLAVDKDLEQAECLYREAHNRGDKQAQEGLYRLFLKFQYMTSTPLEAFLWGVKALWATRIFFAALFGWLFLVIFALNKPFTFNPVIVIAFLVVGPVVTLLVHLAARRMIYGEKGFDSGAIDPEPGFDRMVDSIHATTKEKGYRMLLNVPAEDGLILVPILTLYGINLESAIIGGLVFGILHFPTMTWFACLARAVAYGLVIYFVLPYGLYEIIVGHLLLDFTVVYLAKKEFAASGRETANLSS